MSGTVEALNRAAATWWEWTVASTGQGALLLLLVLAILTAGRSLRPGLRYGLLLVVLLKFAVPPVFGVAYGFSDLLAHAFTNESAPLVNSDLRVTVEASPAPSIPSSTVPVATFVPQVPVLSTKAWLLLLEAAGGAVIVFLIARQCLVARTLIWNGAVAEETLQDRFHAMARSLKLRRTPRLRLSEAAGAPQSGGILRPFVILPAWAATMPEDELDILLAHELAHVRRMDALVNGFQAAAQALLWWNPAVWWLNRRIREEREFCCDDLVLSRGIATGAAYSRTLVNVAERVSLPQSSWAMAGMADNFGAIDRRVRRALEGGQAQRGWGRYGALAVLMLVAGWALPGATDGAEKAFDAPRAAKVEEDFRIRNLTAEKSELNKDGALTRSGNLAFRVDSATSGAAGLEVSVAGELVYSNRDESAKCIAVGEVCATYRDMNIMARRMAFDEVGVVEFFDLTMNGPGFLPNLDATRAVLDLRDGTYKLDQQGRNIPGPELNFNLSGSVQILTMVLELSVGADVLPRHEKRLEDLNGVLLGEGWAEEWDEFRRACQQAIEAGHARLLANPNVQSVHEPMNLSIREEVPGTKTPSVPAQFPGYSVRATPMPADKAKNARNVGIELDIEQGSNRTQFSIPIPTADPVSNWQYHVTSRDDGTFVLIVFRVSRHPDPFTILY
jgi:beta-lactamase regulating signal transducer with metallopeptidase domain